MKRNPLSLPAPGDLYLLQGVLKILLVTAVEYVGKPFMSPETWRVRVLLDEEVLDMLWTEHETSWKWISGRGRGANE